jgi:hypothetical protein
MRITTRQTLPVALLFIAACALGQDIHYNYDRGANFAAYKTYQWIELPRIELPSDPTAAAVPHDLPKIELPSGAPPIDIPGGGPLGASRSGAQEDQLLDQDIQRAVDEQLAHKGLTKVNKNADLQVGYQTHIREEKSINLFGTGGTGGWGAGPGWSGFDSVQGQTSTIPIGTLVVGLYDPARKQLIWRGDASKTVALNKDPNKNYQTLQKALTKLFKNYPPQLNK